MVIAQEQPLAVAAGPGTESSLAIPEAGDYVFSFRLNDSLTGGELVEALGPDGVAVLMPAPSVDLVIEIAEADRLLPEKATSFQPKPSLGVLIRSLRDVPSEP